MKKRITYHITKNNKDGNWQSKIRGNKLPSIISSTKNEVLEKTIKLAKKQLSQIIIHKKNGEIQSERTYGNDPKKYKG